MTWPTSDLIVRLYLLVGIRHRHRCKKAVSQDTEESLNSSCIFKVLRSTRSNHFFCWSLQVCPQTSHSTWLDCSSVVWSISSDNDKTNSLSHTGTNETHYTMWLATHNCSRLHGVMFIASGRLQRFGARVPKKVRRFPSQSARDVIKKRCCNHTACHVKTLTPSMTAVHVCVGVLRATSVFARQPHVESCTLVWSDTASTESWH